MFIKLYTSQKNQEPTNDQNKTHELFKLLQISRFKSIWELGRVHLIVSQLLGIFKRKEKILKFTISGNNHDGLAKKKLNLTVVFRSLDLFWSTHQIDESNKLQGFLIPGI